MSRAGAGVLIVGNLLSITKGIHSPDEDLAQDLAATGRWLVTATSTLDGRAARLWDRLRTAWIRRGQYQIALVSVYSGPAFFWAESVCWLLSRLGKPFILTLNGGNLPEFSRRWPGRVARLLSGARAVVVPSRYLLENMKSFRADIRIIPPPLDLASCPFSLRSRPSPRLIWRRSFHSLYNPTLAVRALASLISSHPDARLSMGGADKGDGTLEETRALATKLGLESRVSIGGPIEYAAVPGWLAQGDIYLNTPNIDNAPVTVLQAMAAGVCVVSTNVGGLPYLLREGEDALLVPPNDPQAMAAAIHRVLTEPGLAERLSRNGRAKAEPLDRPLILTRWEDLMLEVLGSRA